MYTQSVHMVLASVSQKVYTMSTSERKRKMRNDDSTAIALAQLMAISCVYL